jgi:hypothetical protein
MVIRGAKSKPIPGPPAKLIAAEQTTAKAACVFLGIGRRRQGCEAQRHGVNVRLEALPFHLKGEVQDDRQQQSPGSIATCGPTSACPVHRHSSETVPLAERRGGKVPLPHYRDDAPKNG